jgi:hypothetical protein
MYAYSPIEPPFTKWLNINLLVTNIDAMVVLIKTVKKAIDWMVERCSDIISIPMKDEASKSSMKGAFANAAPARWVWK